jgi:hypothetical protein
MLRKAPEGRVSTGRKAQRARGVTDSFSACPNPIIVIFIDRVYVSNTSTNVSHPTVGWCRLNTAKHDECCEPDTRDFKGLRPSA